jgi:hypothetical protein
MDAAFNNDLGHAVPWLIVFVVIVPVIAAGGWLWRLGLKRADTLPASPVPNEHRKALRWATTVTVLGPVLGFGGFVYLSFELRGNHRLAFALAALFLGTAVSDLGAMRLFEILAVRFRRGLGRSRRWNWVLFGLSLAAGGLFLLIGVFWADAVPMP